MKTKKIISGVAMLVVLSVSVWAQSESGEQLFKGNCGYCHTIGKGALTGPDLLGATTRNSEKWLLKWIKSSSTMVKEGDEKAVALFDKYKIVMPDVSLKDDQIKSIVDFLKEQDNVVVNNVAVVKTDTKKNVEKKAEVTNNSQGDSNSKLATGNNQTIFYLGAVFIGFLFIVIYILINVIKTLSAELTAKYRRVSIEK
jgi:hypothetical protein